MAFDIFGDNNDGSEAEQLQSVLFDPLADPQTRKAAREALGFQNKLIQAGIQPEDTTPRESWFTKAFNIILGPQRAVEGIVDSVVNRPEVFNDGIISGLGQSVQRGWDERISGSDILRRAGVENPWVRGIAGFAGDVILDPLSWIGTASKAAARIGGVAASEEGVRAANALKATAGADFLKGEQLADDAFRGIDEWVRHSKSLKLASKSSDVSEALALRLADAESKIKPLLDATGLSKEALPSLLSNKKALKFSLSLPFLGHFSSKKSALQELAKDPSGVGEAIKEAYKAAHPIKSGVASTFGAIGKVLKPGEINLGTADIPEAVLQGFDTIRQYAHEGLATVAEATSKAAKAVENVPVVGGVVDVTRGVGDIVKGVNKAFKRTFNRKALLGVDYRNAELERQAALSYADIASKEATLAHFGVDALTDPKKIDAYREAMLAIDAITMKEVQGAFSKGGILEHEGNKLLKTIQRAGKQPWAVGANELHFLDEAEMLMDLGPKLQAGVDNLLALPSLSPDVKEAIVRIKTGFDDIIKAEHAAGLQVGYLSTYIPHRYEQMGGGSSYLKKKLISDSTKAPFQKQRIYSSLDAAFREKGLIGSTDVASLYQKRLKSSLIARANRSFAQRVMVAHGVPLPVMQKLAKEAQIDPAGAAAQFLRKEGLPIPEVVSKEVYEQAIKDAEFQASIRQQVGKQKAPILADGLRETFGDVSMSSTATRAVKDFTHKVDETLYSVGMRPLDESMFSSVKGELGRIVKKGSLGGETLVLPDEIGRAVEETLAAKDYLREAASSIGGEFGEKLLGQVDAATRFFKKMTTLPWPSYWSGNLIGDGFLRFMDGGINAMDPGIMERMYKLLSGSSSFTNQAGGVLTKEIFEKALAEGGIKFSVNDMLSNIDAFKAADIHQYVKETQSSFLKNLTSPSIDDKKVALTQAQNALRDTFESYMRATHVFHRLEQGDTLKSAIARANEALINYRDLTPWESSVARRVFPFYTWLSRATKKSLTSLMTSPGDIAVQLKSARAFSEFFSSPDAAPTADEFDVKLLENVLTNEQIAIPLGKDEAGKTITARLPALPVNTLLNTISAQMPRSLSFGEIWDSTANSVGRTFQKQIAASNPVIKAVAESLSGKNLYFDKPLDSEFLRKLPSLEEAARRLPGFVSDKIPEAVYNSLDSFTRGWLKGVPDGQGHFIADPGRFWWLMQIPGMARLVSSTKEIGNPDIPVSKGILPFLAPIKVNASSPEATYLAQARAILEKQYRNASVKQRLENQRMGIE